MCFIGYSSLQKRYKCLNPTNTKVYISRQVVFNETVLPLVPNSYSGLVQQDSLPLTMFPATEEWNQRVSPSQKPQSDQNAILPNNAPHISQLPQIDNESHVHQSSQIECFIDTKTPQNINKLNLNFHPKEYAPITLDET